MAKAVKKVKTPTKSKLHSEPLPKVMSLRKRP